MIKDSLPRSIMRSSTKSQIERHVSVALLYLVSATD